MPLERSFEEILTMQLEEIKPPQALPVGTYLCIVDGQPEITRLGENQTDCVVFNLKVAQAQSDVDQNQLAEVLNGDALLDRKITHRMFVTDRSKHRIKKFLADDLGIDPTNSLRKSIMEAAGKQVLVKLTHKHAQDGQTIYENVLSTAKV
jgi:hypothetical protein